MKQPVFLCRPDPSRFARRMVTFALVALPIVSACDGCGDDLDVLAPAIWVDACSQPVSEVDGEFLGGYEECELDFGVADISVEVTAEILVSNPTTIDLSGPRSEDDPEVKDMEVFLTENSDPSFRIKAHPSKVEAGLTKVPIVIAFRPNVESELTATLVIRSDANNVPSGQDVIIPIRGVGVDNGVPEIVVSPAECDFGRVAEGSVKDCEITVENIGGRALVFDEVVLLTEDENGEPYPKVPSGSEAKPFDFFGRPPQSGDVVAPPPETNFLNTVIAFTPDTLGAYASKVAIRTNDPDEPEIIIPLEGIGVDPPVCTVEIASINGFPPPANEEPSIEPLDDVILSAEMSTPSTASGEITSVQWQIVDKPPSSGVVLTSPTGLTTGFSFDNGDDLGIDLAGRYNVRATVLDDLGTESVNDCSVEFEAIPTDSILVQLSWDTPNGDMDLHLTRKDSAGRFCPQGVDTGPVSQQCTGDPPPDCFWANCDINDFIPPDWDENGVQSNEGGGDPSLDVDDREGFGPENINIDVAVEGEYLVGVDYFTPEGGPIGNTIRIYLYGQLYAEFYRELIPSEFWEVAIIKWPDACVEDLSTTATECP